MPISQIRNELLPSLSRTSPSIIPFIILINCLSNPSFHSFYFLGLYIVTFVSNPIIKELIVKPIYKLTDRKELPILGRGERPNGAISCGFALDNIKSSCYNYDYIKFTF
jgi:hypothetical protein